MFSPEGKLNLQDVVKTFQSLLIWYGPVAILFLDQLQRGELDYKPIVALCISISIDLIKRYIRGNTSVTPQ